MSVEAPTIRTNITPREEFLGEGFEDQLHIGKRFRRWAGDCVKRTTSAVVGGVVHGPTMVIETIRLFKWYEHASLAVILGMAGGMTAAVLQDSSGKTQEEPKAPTPTIIAEVRSSQGSIAYTPSYIPPSLIATPTPRRPFGV